MSQPSVMHFATRSEARAWLRLVRHSHLTVAVGDVELTDDGQYAICFYRPTLSASLWQCVRGGR